MSATILDLLREDGTSPVKVASTGGGENASSCPFCGGKDRFRIWSQQDRYWCRQCGAQGDSIQYLRDKREFSFQQACEYIGKKPEEKTIAKKQQVKARNESSELWKKKAEELVRSAHHRLMENSSALKWLEQKRGISPETVQRVKLGLNMRDGFESKSKWGCPEREKDIFIPRGLVIPVYQRNEVNRIKSRYSKRNNKYLSVSGGGNAPMIFEGECESGFVIVVESELDAILLSQECGDIITVIAMGSASNKPDMYTHQILTNAKVILQSFDADDAGAQNAWNWWRKSYAQCKRWPPIEGKDPTEAFFNGVNIRTWVFTGICGVFPEKAIDFFDFLKTHFEPLPESIIDSCNGELIERFSIMTVDSHLTDREAIELLNKSKGCV